MSLNVSGRWNSQRATYINWFRQVIPFGHLVGANYTVKYNFKMCVCAFSRSIMSDSETPWTVAYQTPLSMGILQPRILEWVAMLSSRGSSQLRNQSQVSYFSCIAGRFFTAELLSHWETHIILYYIILYYIILYYIILYYVIIISYHIISYHIISYYVSISYYIKCQIWVYIHHCYLIFLGHETSFLRFS